MIALPLCLGFILGACALIFSAGPTLSHQQRGEQNLLAFGNSSEAGRQQEQQALSAKLVEVTAGAAASLRAIALQPSAQQQLR